MLGYNLLQRISVVILILLLVVSPFYYRENVGGTGLILPFNIIQWLIASIFIFFVLINTFRKNKFCYTRSYIYCLIFPIIVIVEGALVIEQAQPTVWLFRQLYIIGGLLFLLSLLQLNLNNRQIEKLLYYFVFAIFLHSLVGIAEIYEVTALLGWLPLSKAKIPIGMFQQVNLQATYLVTGVMIIFYLISRPSFASMTKLTKILLVITFGLAFFVILSSASRVAILSLIVASLVIIVTRHQQLRRHKLMLVSLFIVAGMAFYSGLDGLQKAGDKIEKLAEGEYQSSRLTMYATAIDLIKNKPILGYGLGNFPRVWAEQTVVFSLQHPDAVISSITTSHPHNELLFWLIEGGLLAFSGLLVILITVCIAIYRCGWSRGGAYTAMLLPITLHTQVEMPFYGSSVHWFLWLFLIYIVFRHQLQTISLTMSTAARYGTQIVLIALALSSISFLLHAHKSQNEIYKYMFEGGGDLKVPFENLYFNSLAQRIIMQNILYTSIEKGDEEQLPMLIEWAEQSSQSNPELGMFLLLNDAYGFINDQTNQCRNADYGLAIYGKNHRLQATVDNECKISEDDQ